MKSGCSSSTGWVDDRADRSGHAAVGTCAANCRVVHTARQDLAQLRGSGGELKVGASTTIAQCVLPRLLARFVRNNAGVQISIVSVDNDKVVQDVLEGESALGLIEELVRQPLLKTEHFLADEIAVIVNPHHPWPTR